MNKDRHETDYGAAQEGRVAFVGTSQDSGTLPRSRARRIEAAFEPVLREEVVRLRRVRRVRGLFALAATLAVVATGLLLRTQGPVSDSAAAVLVRASGPVRMLVPSNSSSGARVLQPGDGIPEGAVLEVGSETRAALRLLGGTSLRLDAETEVLLVSDTLISLTKGSLYVDSEVVGASSTRVQTPMGLVSTVGTQFELRLGAGAMNVRVRDGAVRIDGIGAPVEAKRNEEVFLRDDGSVTRGTVPVHGKDWDWVVEIAPMPERGGTLSNYLAWFEREMGWQLRYSDASLEEDAETIEIQLPPEIMTPTLMLAAVLEACELRHQLVEDVLIIEPSPTGLTD